MKNFGLLKEYFNHKLTESIIKKNDDGKKVFKQYLKMIKENEILKTQFYVYNNITNKYISDSIEAKDYIKENLELLKKFSKEDILKTNKKLFSLLENVKENNYEFKEIHECISKLIFTNKTPNTLDTIIESINVLKNHMIKEKVNETSEYEHSDLPPSVLTKIVVNKFNSKYSDISESEKTIIKTILSSTEEEKVKLFTTMVRECVDTIDQKLTLNEDIEIKSKLLSAKDKLLRMEYIKENFITDISKIHQLKSNIEY